MQSLLAFQLVFTILPSILIPLGLQENVAFRIKHGSREESEWDFGKIFSKTWIHKKASKSQTYMQLYDHKSKKAAAELIPSNQTLKLAVVKPFVADDGETVQKLWLSKAWQNMIHQP
jgi:hypothetical protein